MSNQLKRFQPKIVHSVVIWAIILTGILFRIRQYLFNRSLWTDEALLAISFVKFSLKELINRPLLDNQAAPSGFIVLTKIIIGHLGNKDYTLRIIPIISGILIVLCAFFLSRTVYKTSFGRIIFIALMAFSPILIYYSSEFKQYSVDVLVTTALLLVALTYQKYKYGEFLLAGMGAICVWFSFPSIFTLASIGIVLFIDELRKKNLRALYRLVLIGIIWIASFSRINLSTLHDISANQYLLNFWQLGYAPFPVHSLQDLWWYLENILGLIYIAFQQFLPPPAEANPNWFGFLNLAYLLIFIGGIVFTYKRSRKLFFISAAIIGFNLAASALHIYPFRSRLILYLVPIIFLFVAMFIEELYLSNKHWQRIASYGIALFLIAMPLLTAANIFVKPISYPNIKGAMNFLESEIKPDDYISLNAWAYAPFMYYRRRYDFKQNTFTGQIPDNNSAANYLESLCRGNTLGRTWIIYTQDLEGVKSFIDRLTELRPLLASWNSDRAGVYLFDFSGLETCNNTI